MISDLIASHFGMILRLWCISLGLSVVKIAPSVHVHFERLLHFNFKVVSFQASNGNFESELYSYCQDRLKTINFL